jgi:hypothetical protein
MPTYTENADIFLALAPSLVAPVVRRVISLQIFLALFPGIALYRGFFEILSITLALSVSSTFFRRLFHHADTFVALSRSVSLQIMKRLPLSVLFATSAAVRIGLIPRIFINTLATIQPIASYLVATTSALSITTGETHTIIKFLAAFLSLPVVGYSQRIVYYLAQFVIRFVVVSSFQRISSAVLVFLLDRLTVVLGEEET